MKNLCPRDTSQNVSSFSGVVVGHCRCRYTIRRCRSRRSSVSDSPSYQSRLRSSDRDAQARRSARLRRPSRGCGSSDPVLRLQGMRNCIGTPHFAVGGGRNELESAGCPSTALRRVGEFEAFPLRQARELHARPSCGTQLVPLRIRRASLAVDLGVLPFDSASALVATGYPSRGTRPGRAARGRPERLTEHASRRASRACWSKPAVSGFRHRGVECRFDRVELAPPRTSSPAFPGGDRDGIADRHPLARLASRLVAPRRGFRRAGVALAKLVLHPSPVGGPRPAPRTKGRT